MIIVSRKGLLGEPDAEIRRLRALLRDLEQIAAGYQPGAELSDAPFLDDYTPSFRWEPCLIGIVQGHPIVRGPAIQTSGLWAYAPDLGWARTLSRFYRLGQPLAKAGGVQ